MCKYIVVFGVYCSCGEKEIVIAIKTKSSKKAVFEFTLKKWQATTTFFLTKSIYKDSAAGVKFNF